MEEILDYPVKEDEITDLGTAFKWWERKRGKYNLVVGLVGFLPLLFSGAIFDRDGGWVALIICLIWAIVANIFYFSGWLMEAFAWKVLKSNYGFLHKRELVFNIGFALSILITGFCSLFIAIMYVSVYWGNWD